MAETISRINPTVLKVHPRNAEFFDDIDGAEFDRLVESIKDHGVLTPLRITKDMTIISGHQRMRAAIKAGCSDVPVIIDDDNDENDVLMKLIETNFGRMKNDPIKQAKWIEEYKSLKGIQRGGDKAKGNNFTLQDIADKLGVDVRTVKNISSLSKLDPALQALLSDGKINATTGFKILSKLSPEEQIALLDKLPDDVKFSAKSIQEHIDQMREELNGNTSKAMQERDKAVGEKERLQRENNELRAGALPISAETQEKIRQLEQEVRDNYEKYQASEKGKDTLRAMLKDYSDENDKLKAAINGGDEGAIALQNEIDTLKRKLEAQERKSNDLEFQLEEKDDQIKDLKRENKEGFMRKALRIDESPEEISQRERDALISNIQIAIGQFQASVEGVLTQTDSLYDIDKAILKVLVETCSQAVSAGTRLKVALLTASGFDDGETGDEDYELDDSGLDYDLGA